jgi:divalent metal cation (Fe/Co/Zn/Cd) transporter
MSEAVIYKEKYLRLAIVLSIITIGYNMLEGIISTYFGASDDTLALFGFGADSFVEVISGIGIWHMVRRMQSHEVATHDQFEVTALKTTGVAFYLLVAGLLIGAGSSIYHQSTPSTTQAGVIISAISILTMYFLYKEKLKTGLQLESQPIISDAHCTKTCFYLSFILLFSSGIYMIFKIPYIDALGSLGIAWYAWKEGREAFQKANTKSTTCNDGC